MRDAEVGDARGPVDADEDVLGRDVAVDDVERLAVVVAELVRRVEARERIETDAECGRRPGGARPDWPERARRRAAVSPSMYSMTR